jgi:hypothetical protein
MVNWPVLDTCILSGIGTDPPARQRHFRQHSIALVALVRGCTAGADGALCEMK